MDRSPNEPTRGALPRRLLHADAARSHPRSTGPGRDTIMEHAFQPSRRRVLHVAATAGAAALLGERTADQARCADTSPMRIIDPHVHVWKNDPRYPWPKELTEPPKNDALPETLLRLMQTHGIDRTVIVHVIHYRWDC